ncbi:MAG: hypothetical protein U5R06_14985 [candidate division KSB1 bacterium]|nr:hypothetical protein [candidate division KSB1 bacterium]
MKPISAMAADIFQCITAHPFYTLFIALDLLFLYGFAAGWGFVTSNEHTVKGPERFFRGR